MARIYSVQKGWMGDNREIIAWEMSRFGDAHDAEMEQAVSKAAQVMETVFVLDFLLMTFRG